MTDAAVIELAGVVADGAPTGVCQTLIVDGQIVPPTALATELVTGAGWIAGAIRIDFGSQAIRDIWVQTGLYVACVKIGQYDTMFPVDDQAEPQVTVIGGSYLQRPWWRAMPLGARGIGTQAATSVI
jgi:hypothetical protein